MMARFNSLDVQAHTANQANQANPRLSEDIMRMAVQANGQALQYIPTPLSEDLLRVAVQSNAHALQYIPASIVNFGQL